MQTRTLIQELFLLGIDERTAAKPVGSSFPYGLAGAALTELAIRGRIEFTGRRERDVRLLSSAGTGDRVLDQVLFQIATSHRGRQGKWWVQKIGRSALVNSVVAQLVADSAIAHEPRRILAVIPADRFHVLNPAEVADLRMRVAATARTGVPLLDERAAALALLAHACGLSKRVWPDLGWLARERRHRELGAMPGSEAVRLAIQAAGAASAAVSDASSGGDGDGGDGGGGGD